MKEEDVEPFELPAELALDKNDLWYLDFYGGTKSPSEVGLRGAILLRELFMGMHHVDTHQISRINWEDPYFIQYNHRGESLATHDPDYLTRLVLWAHRLCLRVEIEPCNFKHVSIKMWSRKNRKGRFDERHPKMSERLNKLDY